MAHARGGGEREHRSSSSSMHTDRGAEERTLLHQRQSSVRVASRVLRRTSLPRSSVNSLPGADANSSVYLNKLNVISIVALHSYRSLNGAFRSQCDTAAASAEAAAVPRQKCAVAATTS
ncbi:hypothetical protein JIQ42_07610 [Leishmania sp. Namibia]|uniref:hypothetical protein n=1 Tax=Leishmania sp. Namibia TaxID=2802991 RepID=UPI001B594F4E|nr:hypothetical protein JIQ42_07610 [Leishmania sp. Namibia]